MLTFLLFLAFVALLYWTAALSNRVEVLEQKLKPKIEHPRAALPFQNKLVAAHPSPVAPADHRRHDQTKS